jgi:hypothetical protein
VRDRSCSVPLLVAQQAVVQAAVAFVRDAEIAPEVSKDRRQQVIEERVERACLSPA